MTAEDLTTLIAALAPMTDERREEQRRSFAYGNAAISNSLVTREMIDRAADEVAAERDEDVTPMVGKEARARTLLRLGADLRSPVEPTVHFERFGPGSGDVSVVLRCPRCCRMVADGPACFFCGQRLQ